MNEIEIYAKISQWLNNKKEVAIANVIETWGSSPRPVGSIMAINNDHDIIGSVSGGCVESFVFGKALEIIKHNNVATLEFGVTNSKAWEVGLTCGGKIKVFLEKVSHKDLDLINKINDIFTKNEIMVIATRLNDGKRDIFDNFSKKKSKHKLKINFNTIKSGIKLFENQEWFIKVFQNSTKIIIIGAVHIAEPLINFANHLAYEVILVDPRSTFNEKKFNNIKIFKDWPDEALQKVIIDKNTAIITLTHDPKLDDPALEYSLTTDAFYIGCLGSKKTHNSRILRLKRKGISEQQLKKLNGPVGISIGAKTPTEIAISIISQIILFKNTVDA